MSDLTYKLESATVHGQIALKLNILEKENAELKAQLEQTDKELEMATAHTVYGRHGKQLQGVEGVLDELDNVMKRTTELEQALYVAADRIALIVGWEGHADKFRAIAKGDSDE